MKDIDLAVTRELNVKFDTITVVSGFRERGEGIFRRITVHVIDRRHLLLTGAGMEPAVSVVALHRVRERSVSGLHEEEKDEYQNDKNN